MLFKILDILAPAVLGILCLLYNTESKKLLYFLSAFFMFTAFGELVGLILTKLPVGANTAFYDKFFIPTSYLVNFALFWWIIQQRLYKNIIVILSIVYLVSFIIEKFIMVYDVKEFSYLSYCLGAIISVAICLIYLFTLVKSPSILFFKSDIMFWFSLGTLFFQLFTFPFYALMEFWFRYPKIGNAYYYFSFFCIYISYSFYLTGILCSKRK